MSVSESVSTCVNERCCVHSDVAERESESEKKRERERERERKSEIEKRATAMR